MPSTPSRAPSNAQPALRIPTFDSMKRFSAATDFSDMPDFEFTKPMDEDPLILPDYLLKEIDTGREADAIVSLRHQCNRVTTGESFNLDFATDLPSRDGSKDKTESEGKLGTRDSEAGLGLMAAPARPSSRRVPFNPSRPVSQITTSADGITALPMLASRGLLFSNHALRDNDSPVLPPTRRKRKASSALSGPIKRLRNLSFDAFTSRGRQKRRESSLSCINDIATTDGRENGSYDLPPNTKKLNRSPPSPASPSSATRIPSTPTPTFSTPTPTPTPTPTLTARHPNTNTLATTIIPTYPPSSHPHPHIHLQSPRQQQQSPSSSSPAQLPLLPLNNDSISLTALQELISTLHAENETLKQQVQILREDLYATHEELLVERYEGWEKELRIEKLKLRWDEEFE